MRLCCNSDKGSVETVKLARTGARPLGLGKLPAPSQGGCANHGTRPRSLDLVEFFLGCNDTVHGLPPLPSIGSTEINHGHNRRWNLGSGRMRPGSKLVLVGFSLREPTVRRSDCR
jgi:hypothetical protein